MVKFQRMSLYFFYVGKMWPLRTRYVSGLSKLTYMEPVRRL